MFDFINGLFDDIGEKLKRSAVAIFTINVVLIIIAAAIGMLISLAWLIDGDSLGLAWFFLAPICAIVEILAFILPMQLLYAFGELVSNSTKLAYPATESVTEAFATTTTTTTPTTPSNNLAKKNAPIVTEDAPQGEAWNCPKCGRANHPSRTTCRHCDAPKPNVIPKKAPITTQSPIVQESLGMQANAAGWTCKNCGKANHPSRTTCRHCGADQ